MDTTPTYTELKAAQHRAVVVLAAHTDALVALTALRSTAANMTVRSDVLDGLVEFQRELVIENTDVLVAVNAQLKAMVPTDGTVA